MTDTRQAFEAFHPDASHVTPDYRDGWNHCHAAAQAELARLREDAGRYQFLETCHVSFTWEHDLGLQNTAVVHGPTNLRKAIDAITKG